MKKVAPIVLAVLLVILCGNIAANNFGGKNGGSINTPTLPGVSRDIRLAVRATAQISVTYNNGTNQSQENNVMAPWIKDFKTNSIMPTAIIAQDMYGGDTITCEIYVNGKLQITNRSTGAYSVVTCTETIG